MLYESRPIIDADNNNDNNSMVIYQRNTHFGSAVQYTSSMVVNLRQLQTDLQAQHQHEKNALNELNQRFQLFVDRIQLLQSQNLKYLAAISDYRRQFSGISIDVKWEENYFSQRSNLSIAHHAVVDYEWDFELFQLQIGIYQKLIEIEQQTKDKRILSLEEELKQSASVLISLRRSYDELKREVDNLHAESDDLFKQYMSLAHNWCNIKKQRRKWNLSIEALKNYIGFYKSIRSYSGRESSFVSIQTGDSIQYWTLELDNVIKKIRRDFEAFYASIYREMTTYYETKMVESETNIKKAVQYQRIETEQFTVYQEKYKIEYESVQKSFTYEKEILIKLESTYSKLEAEFKSLQYHHEEQFAIQSNDLQIVQENMVVLAYDVDEIRRSKASLEVEIIIYRQLLEVSGIEVPAAIIARTHATGNGMMRKFAIKKQKKGPIGIKECAPNGSYISLMNYSTNSSIDISRWLLTRNIDTGKKLRYTIPDGVQLEQGRELRIYGKLNGGGSSVESPPFHKLVNNNLVSWGEGNTIETYLFNQNGEEEAAYFQSVVFQSANV